MSEPLSPAADDDSAPSFRQVLASTRDWSGKLAEVPAAELALAAEAASSLAQLSMAELASRSAADPAAGPAIVATTLDIAPSLLTHSSQAAVKAILGDGALQQRARQLEDEVHFTVDPRTRSGLRLKELLARIDSYRLDDARPDDGALARTEDALRRAGFRILRVGRFGIRASGPARLVSDVLGVPLEIAAVPRNAGSRATRMFAAAPLPPTPGELFVSPRKSIAVDASRLDAAINDFVFIPPPILLGPVPYPASMPSWAIDRKQMRSLLKGPVTGGKGVRTAIVDTGFDFKHPYFGTVPFDTAAVSTLVGPDADVDPEGHGTAMAASLLAIAPECALRGYKMTDPGSAIEIAAEEGARIISCSWGYDYEAFVRNLHTSLRSVIEDDGCILLFAAGNGQYCWPASDPKVLAVGGVYADPQTSALCASDFASGFVSSLYPDRQVPDFCGLCGQAPEGIYLPLPVPPGCQMDRATGGFSFPDKDETGVDDGWVYASGTSSATAQVAGVVALMLEHAQALGKALSPEQVKHILQQSAQPVTTGHNAHNRQASGHPNVAVGYGLVNADAALGLVSALP